jgi:hypothetical protein
MAQSETLTIDALELYAQDATTKVAVTADLAKLANDLNGSDHASDLSIPTDTKVLKRDAAQVFLIVRYRLLDE